MIDLTTCTATITSADPLLATLPVLCAWCLQEQNLLMGTGSHGICIQHAQIVRAAHKARKSAARLLETNDNQ